MPVRPPRPAMGIATDKTAANKQAYLAFLNRLSSGNLDDMRSACGGFFSTDAALDIAHPINTARGGDGYFDEVLAPMQLAFDGFQRRTDILIGGNYLGGEWVTSMGYFCGHFFKPWLGIKPSNRLAFIRLGEFHCIFWPKLNTDSGRT